MSGVRCYLSGWAYNTKMMARVVLGATCLVVVFFWRLGLECRTVIGLSTLLSPLVYSPVSHLVMHVLGILSKWCN
jgi:hypothetical protein